MRKGELLSAVSAASHLQVHRRTILRFIRRGYFPNAFKAGQAWRIPKADIEEWERQQIERGRQAAASDED